MGNNCVGGGEGDGRVKWEEGYMKSVRRSEGIEIRRRDRMERGKTG